MASQEPSKAPTPSTSKAAPGADGDASSPNKPVSDDAPPGKPEAEMPPPRPPSKFRKCMMNCCKSVRPVFVKLFLVILKGVLVRKHQWFITLLEITFPIIAIAAFLGATGKGENLHPDTAFLKVDTRSMRGNVSSRGTIVYTPKNSETDEIMQNLVSVLCDGCGIKLESDDEATIEKKVKGPRNNQYPDFIAAIVFPDNLKELRAPGSNNGILSYKIRLSEWRTPVTKALFSDKAKIGPHLAHYRLYIMSGFLGLQEALDRVIIKKLSGQDQLPREVKLRPFSYPTYPHKAAKGEVIGHTALVGFFLGMTNIFFLVTIVRNFVHEKRTGVMELLKLNGVSPWMQWLGYFLNSFVPSLFVISIITVLLFEEVGEGPLLLAANPFVVWVGLLLYIISSIFFCFLICSIFENANMALSFGVIIWLLSSFLGYFIPITDNHKLALAILPNCGVCYAIAVVALMDSIVESDDDMAVGAQWDNLDEIYMPEADMEIIKERLKSKKIDFDFLYLMSGICLRDVMLVMLGSSLVYLLLAIYLDAVLPRTHGVSRPWYFFTFRCGRKKVQSQQNQVILPPPPPPVLPAVEQQGSGDGAPPLEGKDPSSIRSNENNQETMTEANVNMEEPVPDAITAQILQSFEPEPQNTPVGIELNNLVKKFTYTNGFCRWKSKSAVNGVNLRMYAGDIFALLGHNGAGKTTIISMITGFFAPTSGSVLVQGYDLKYDLDKARRYIGYCPQDNLLFERLSVHEQLILFGMLRGKRWGEASKEADMWLMKMGLFMGKRWLGRNLSGGQKRKLCLGMALMGGTSVLILDEPTTGLDPQSRRSIWDILLELRGDRTILITTHFMEEADVLGDRIGIVCDGQLFCCGSVAFLKKRFGFGATLKLTLGTPLPVQEPPPPPQITEEDAPPPVPEEGAPPPVPEEAAPPPDMSQPEVPEIDPVTEKLVEFTQKHINNAYPKLDVRRKKINEVLITLPDDTTNTASICSLMADLTKNKENLDVQKVTLLQTTMDEVFLRVGQLAEQQAGVVHYEWSPADFVPARKQKGAARFLTQFYALFVKRITFLLRKPVTFIIEFLLYLGIMLVFLWLYIYARSVLLADSSGSGSGRAGASGRSSVLPRNVPGPTTPTTLARLISLDDYKSPITICSSEDRESAKIAAYVPGVISPGYDQVNDYKVTTYYQDKAEEKILEDILEVGENDVKMYKYRYIISTVVTKLEYLGLFNPVADHAAPLALNVASNALLRAVTSTDKYTIQVSNHPLHDPNGQPLEVNDNPPTIPTPRGRSLSGRQSESSSSDNEVALFMEIYFYPLFVIFAIPLIIAPLLMTSTFVKIPTEERLCSAKRLQIMTGVHPAIYWLSMFLWDYILYGIFVCGVVGVTFALEEYKYHYRFLTRGDGWLALFLILMAYGYSAISFVYLLTLNSSTVVGAFACAIFTGIITGIFVYIPVIPIFFQELLLFDQMAGFFFKLPAFVFPHYPLLECLGRYLAHAFKAPICDGIGSKCETGKFLQFTRPYIGRSLFNGFKSTDVEAPGILMYILLMVLIGLIYTIILMLNEYLIIEKIRNRDARASPGLPFGTDDDVLEEAKRVNELIVNKKVGEEALLVQSLTKIFQKCCQKPQLAFTSVDQLSFGVHYGECFGLLGINGAGKTTTFRIITGDTLPTGGNAFGFGKSLTDNRMEFFQHFGYCPQFDACLPIFTGREMLEMFAMLRGMPRGVAKMEANKWLQRMDLQDKSDHQCGRYSGGMKRRISIAIAMIGDPELMLLDEPTSGVDPVNRMKFWQIVEIMRDMAGHSVILTSHSMDECEALCARLGIMVNGQFQCFGEVQHLKEKFARGYSLVLHLLREMPSETTPPDDDLMDKLAQMHEKLTEQFGEVVLKDKHRKVVQYYVLNPTIPLDVMYQTMEKIYSELNDVIGEYVLSETSLEEVFLAFAKGQGAEFSDKTNFCQRICKCCPCC